MINLTTMELHAVLDSILKSDMVYIQEAGNGYEAHVHTRSIPEGIDEDELHDLKMMELDSILDYFFAVWKLNEEKFGPYDKYAEKIRDFVIDNIQVKFHPPVWEIS